MCLFNKLHAACQWPAELPVCQLKLDISLNTSTRRISGRFRIGFGLTVPTAFLEAREAGDR